MAKKQKAILRTQAEKDALRIATGRPTKYDPSIIQKFTEYFSTPITKEITKKIITKTGDVIEIPETVAGDFPTLAGFSLSIGIDRTTLKKWADEHPDFSLVYEKAREYQENYLVNNGLKGLVQQPMAIFIAKNKLDWSDKKEIKHEGQIDSVVSVQPFDIEARKKQLKGEE
jgi:hypothetical protein